MNTAVVNGRPRPFDINTTQTLNVVVVDAPLSARQAGRLESLSPKVRLWREPTPEALSQAQVLYSEPAGVCSLQPSEVPRLRWVQLDTVACDGVEGCPLAQQQLEFANVRGAYSPAVAEFAIGLLITLMRRLERCRDLQNERVWSEDALNLGGHNCYGKTLGIVGYGSIGRQIGRVASAMGMRVLACKRRPDVRADSCFALPGSGDSAGTIPEAWFGIEQITELFSRSDAVIVTLPRTGATLNLIGRDELSALPENAVLVNIGRGGVLDEAALAGLLNSGHLGGAALDVAAQEPLPNDHWLWKTQNLILTPHIASYTLDQEELAAEVLIENVRRHLNGDDLVNVVSLAEGY